MANKQLIQLSFFFLFFLNREKKFPIEIPDYTRTRNRPITRPLSPVELSMTRQRRLRIQKHRFYARQHRILICIWMAYLSRYFQPIGINVKRAEVTIYIYIYIHIILRAKYATFFIILVICTPSLLPTCDFSS